MYDSIRMYLMMIIPRQKLLDFTNDLFFNQSDYRFKREISKI